MAVAPAVYFSQDFASTLDDLLLQICEELQLSTPRYELAAARYGALNKLLESTESPFRYFRPEIYPQGSMALGTTVRPVDGRPHDLDFVLELNRPIVDPMGLIRSLYEFVRRHGVYRPMTSLKNRCVRIEYADEFYMDVLPACRNSALGMGCVKIPDCSQMGWCDSNPTGYTEWFKQRSRVLLVDRILDKAAAIPAQEEVRQKKPLQLVVQLVKRWRDLHYQDYNPSLVPVSVVLTTLTADVYRGESSVSKALSSALTAIVERIESSRRRGERHLRLCNPSNRAEDLTERWDSSQAAYEAFVGGIRDLHQRWSQLVAKGGNVSSELEDLFGEQVKTVLRKQAQRLQESRLSGKLGVTGGAGIVSAIGASARVMPNTFHGAE
jgi:SMODS domain-containing protein